MITSIAQSIASYLIRNKIIESEKLDIYIYGFEIMISTIVSILVGLVLGIVFSQLTETIVFLLIFVLLRSYCGGYHTDTYLKCNIVFAVNITAVMLILKFVSSYPFVINVAVIAFALLTIAMLAPVENIYKPLTKSEKKSYKIKASFLTATISVIAFISLTVSEYYSLVIGTALFSVSVSMIIENLKKGRVSYEKHKKGNA